MPRIPIPGFWMICTRGRHGAGPAVGKEIAVAIRTHRNLNVNRVLKSLKGRVIMDILYFPKDEEMLAGYEKLRSIVIWASEQDGAGPVPGDVVTVMRWLRAHFGPDEARKAAIAQFGATKPAQAELVIGRRLELTEVAEILCDADSKTSGGEVPSWAGSSEKRREKISTTAAGLMSVVVISEKSPA